MDEVKLKLKKSFKEFLTAKLPWKITLEDPLIRC